jgi:hypothetical protein
MHEVKLGYSTITSRSEHNSWKTWQRRNFVPHLSNQHENFSTQEEKFGRLALYSPGQDPGKCWSGTTQHRTWTSTARSLSPKSRDSSVGIVLGYGLDDWCSKVRFPTGDVNFSLHHRVQNGSGAHLVRYPTVPGSLSLGVKRAGREADQSPPSSAEVKE